MSICMHHPGAIDRAAKIAGAKTQLTRLREVIGKTHFTTEEAREGFILLGKLARGEQGDE